jgi:hypothetical protein
MRQWNMIYLSCEATQVRYPVANIEPAHIYLIWITYSLRQDIFSVTIYDIY